ncbi:MAG: electron transport complex subunit RsxC [Clostridia bacterium]|nr:electron transport complex subunit RsxC [Clostridia bacterium]
MNREELNFPKKPFFTRGGAKVPHRKNTANCESVVLTDIPEVMIPMSQHIGAHCKPVVAKGDKVYVGTVVGDSDAFVSAPVHSSVSGEVKDIIYITLPNGVVSETVVITSDGLFEKDPAIKPPVVENKADFLKAVRASGLVGLGGAGFPAHVKLNVPADKEIDTLLINCAECEPYITTDHREVLENSWNVFSGIYAVKDILGVKRVIIGIEKNKPDAIKLLKEMADNQKYDPDDVIRVLPLKSSYPQGAEKVLIKACTGRVVPTGKLPSDVGCVVMNVASVSFVAEYLKTGMPLVRKRLTVDGSAIKNPQNVIVPIGTPVNRLIELCGGYKEECGKLLMGGPMMGIALFEDTAPVLKQNNAILAFNKKEASTAKGGSCIRCGKCIDACPMGLVPTKIALAAKKNQVDVLKEYNTMTCMECGCCTVTCPAQRYIVQSIRLGKAILREEARKEKGAEVKK